MRALTGRGAVIIVVATSFVDGLRKISLFELFLCHSTGNACARSCYNGYVCWSSTSLHHLVAIQSRPQFAPICATRCQLHLLEGVDLLVAMVWRRWCCCDGRQAVRDICEGGATSDESSRLTGALLATRIPMGNLGLKA